VILQNGDNKYKEGPFEAREVASETGDWLDLGTLDIVDFGDSNQQLEISI
jgi:hypothetical protein